MNITIDTEEKTIQVNGMCLLDELVKLSELLGGGYRVTGNILVNKQGSTSSLPIFGGSGTITAPFYQPQGIVNNC